MTDWNGVGVDWFADVVPAMAKSRHMGHGAKVIRAGDGCVLSITWESSALSVGNIRRRLAANNVRQRDGQEAAERYLAAADRAASRLVDVQKSDDGYTFPLPIPMDPGMIEFVGIGGGESHDARPWEQHHVPLHCPKAERLDGFAMEDARRIAKQKRALKKARARAGNSAQRR